MSVVLAAAVERAVGRVLGEANGQVEALIAAELDRQLQQLVAGQFAARNANGQPQAPAQGETRSCRRCNRDLPASAFEKGRATCRQCRREQEAARAARITADTAGSASDAAHP